MALRKQGAWHLVVDLRRTAEGAPALGFASARLFVATGTLGAREGRTVPKQVTAASSGDGIITLPITLLTDNGTSQAAEVFAAALKGNKRATLVGERTLGRAASQELVRLPDGSGLWLSTARFVTPDGASIHEKGLTPDTAVAEPELEFGASGRRHGSHSRQGPGAAASRAGRLTRSELTPLSAGCYTDRSS